MGEDAGKSRILFNHIGRFKSSTRSFKKIYVVLKHFIGQINCVFAS